MTYQEIAKEFLADYIEELRPLMDSCFGRRSRMVSFINKHLGPKEMHVFEKREHLSRRNNQWHCFFWSKGKKQYKQNGILKCLYMSYQRSDGMHFVTCDPHNPNLITFYTPHFFERYRERYLHNTGMSATDALLDYALNSHASHGKHVQSPKYKNSLFMISGVGVSLGEDIGNGIWEYRTFISFEMLKGNQTDMKEEYLPIIEAIRNDTGTMERKMVGIKDRTIRNGNLLDFRIKLRKVMEYPGPETFKVSVRLTPSAYNAFVNYVIETNGEIDSLYDDVPAFGNELMAEIEKASSGIDISKYTVDLNAILKYAREKEEREGNGFIV